MLGEVNKTFVSVVNHGVVSGQTQGGATTSPARMRARDVDVFYGDKQALFGVDMDVSSNQVTALIGPSGCGKSTTARAIIQLPPPSEGEIYFENVQLSSLNLSLIHI